MIWKPICHFGFFTLGGASFWNFSLPALKGREQRNAMRPLHRRSVNFILGLLVGFSTINNDAKAAGEATVERLRLPLSSDASRGSSTGSARAALLQRGDASRGSQAASQARSDFAAEGGKQAAKQAAVARHAQCECARSPQNMQQLRTQSPQTPLRTMFAK